jgi:hypothetical protein
MTASAPIASRPVLTFDEEPHIYRVDGRAVPSVTQVIKEAYGDLVWPWRDEFAMDRGRLVHHALHLWAQRDLDVKSLSEYIAGYVAAGIRWLSESGFELQASEHRMYSAIYDYAGTCDIIGVLDRKSAVVDYKTGEPGWAAGPQTWAYVQAWQEETGEVIRNRYGLRLFEDGGYQLIPYKSDRDDKADFLAARRVVARRSLLAS